MGPIERGHDERPSPGADRPVQSLDVGVWALVIRASMMPGTGASFVAIGSSRYSRLLRTGADSTADPVAPPPEIYTVHLLFTNISCNPPRPARPAFRSIGHLKSVPEQAR